MDSKLTVNACIGIRDGCDMKYLINADGQIEFSFGGVRYPLELAFNVAELRHFVELAGDALEKVAMPIVRGAGDDAGQLWRGDEPL